MDSFKSGSEIQKVTYHENESENLKEVFIHLPIMVIASQFTENQRHRAISENFAHFFIPDPSTLYNTKSVIYGDWIIEKPDGSIVSMSDDEFKKNYKKSGFWADAQSLPKNIKS